jgi:hypothetical protein
LAVEIVCWGCGETLIAAAGSEDGVVLAVVCFEEEQLAAKLVTRTKIKSFLIIKK